MSDLAGRMKKHAKQAPATKPAPAQRQAEAPKRPKPSQSSSDGAVPWEERVRRATWHVDIELLERLDRVSKREGISKSRLVREALTRHLDDLEP